MKKRCIGTIITALAVFILSAVIVYADGNIIEDYTEGRYGIYYVKNLPGGVTDASTQIGTETAETTECLGIVPDQTDYRIKTLILIDNSLSIRDGGREAKIKDLLTQIISGHANREIFSICTFSETITELSGFSDDYNGLLNIVQSISYANQDAYLINAIYDSVNRLVSDGTSDYKRLIVVSDGVNDNKSNYNSFTPSELIDLLKESSCPVYTIGCKWAKDDTGLNNLFSYARQSGGASFELDTIQDLNQIISVIQQDYGTQMFRVKVPLSELNSGMKAVRLTVNTSAGQQICSKTMAMPELSQQEIDSIAAAEKEALQPVTEPSTETTTETTVQTTETTTEAPSFLQKLTGEYKNYLIAGAVLLVLIIAAIAALLLKKKKDDAAFFDDSTVNGQNNDYLTELNNDDDKTIMMTANSEDDKTEAMWGTAKGKALKLIDKSSSHIYECYLESTLVLGRRESVCDVEIGPDKTISGRHCRLILEDGDIYIEDLDSSNGTFVNGRSVAGMTKLNKGDCITLGNTKLVIQY